MTRMQSGFIIGNKQGVFVFHPRPAKPPFCHFVLTWSRCWSRWWRWSRIWAMPERKHSLFTGGVPLVWAELWLRFSWVSQSCAENVEQSTFGFYSPFYASTHWVDKVGYAENFSRKSTYGKVEQSTYSLEMSISERQRHFLSFPRLSLSTETWMFSLPFFLMPEFQRALTSS